MKLLIQLKRGSLIGMILLSLCTQSVQSQWEKINGLYGGTVLCMAANDTLLFAGTMLGVSVYRVNDTASSWKPFIAPPIPEITALALFRDSLVVATPAGIYNTALNNPELKDMQLNLPHNNIQSLAVYTNNLHTYLIANVKSSGLFAFFADTYSWYDWNSLLPSTHVIDLVQGFHQGLFVYTYFALLEDNIYMCNELLHEWLTPVAFPYGWKPHTIQFVNENLFAGTDNGIYRKYMVTDPWEQNPSLPGKRIVQLHKVAPGNDSTGIVAVASDNSIYYSKDIGITWIQAHPAYGILSTPISFLNNGDQSFIGSDGGGIYYSSDLATWHFFEPRLEEADVRSIVDFGGIMYVGTRGAGVYRSMIYGGFEQLSNELPSLDISYVAVAGFNVVVCAGGFMYYLDHNDHWHDFSYNMHDPNACVGISYTNYGVPMTMAKSTGIWSIDFHNDSVWHPMNNGLEEATVTEMTTGNGQMYICQPYTGVSTFNESDSLWVPFTTNGLGTDYLSTLCVHDSMIVTGSFEGIRTLRPPYEQWTEENSGLSVQNINKLETFGDLIFATVYPRNIYVAKASDLQWHDRSDNLPEYTFIWDIYVDGDYVWAASNRSLWKRNMEGMSPGIYEQQSASRVVVYPNPCREQVYIESELPGGKVTGIQLLDLRGRVLIDQLYPMNGKEVVSLSMTGIPPGLYLLKVNAYDGPHTCKLIKN
jgi:hypothetical protein